MNSTTSLKYKIKYRLQSVNQYGNASEEVTDMSTNLIEETKNEPEWQTQTKKSRKKNCTKKQQSEEKINQQEAFEKIRKYFSEIPGVKAVYVYGSVARNEHRPTSDVDIMVFFKSFIPQLCSNDRYELTQEVMKKELTKILNKEVKDMTCYVYNPKNCYKIGKNRITVDYIENVKRDAVIVYSENSNINPLHEMILR